MVEAVEARVVDVNVCEQEVLRPQAIVLVLVQIVYFDHVTRRSTNLLVEVTSFDQLRYILLKFMRIRLRRI